MLTLVLVRVASFPPSTLICNEEIDVIYRVVKTGVKLVAIAAICVTILAAVALINAVNLALM